MHLLKTLHISRMTRNNQRPKITWTQYPMENQCLVEAGPSQDSPCKFTVHLSGDWFTKCNPFRLSLTCSICNNIISVKFRMEMPGWLEGCPKTKLQGYCAICTESIVQDILQVFKSVTVNSLWFAHSSRRPMAPTCTPSHRKAGAGLNIRTWTTQNMCHATGVKVIAGMCWRAHLPPPRFGSGTLICLENMLIFRYHVLHTKASNDYSVSSNPSWTLTFYPELFLPITFLVVILMLSSLAPPSQAHRINPFVILSTLNSHAYLMYLSWWTCSSSETPRIAETMA
jgi:hypothetical protein